MSTPPTGDPLLDLLKPIATAAVVALGKRLLGRITTRSRRAIEPDVLLAKSLDTWSLSSDVLSDPHISLPIWAPAADITATLQFPEGQALVHQLMAARMAGAPDVKAARIGDGLEALLSRRLRGRASEQEIEVLARAIFGRLDVVCLNLIDHISTKAPDALRDVQANAQATLLNATVDNIERYVSSMEKRRQVAAEQRLVDWEAAYRPQLAHAHGFLEPPDFERKRKIALEKLYVSPDIYRTGTPSSTIEIDEFETLIDRTVLLGDPGGGKSTASSVLAYRLGQQGADTVPFLVVLRDFAAESRTDTSVVAFIEERLANYYQCPAPPGGVEDLLVSGKAVVLFDGLDELLDTSRRREITERVELFSSRYPMARMLVTSRRVGYDQARMDPGIFDTYEIAGFSESNVNEYITNWFREVEALPGHGADQARDAFIAESQTVPDLRRNPLMLSLMCIIYRGENFLPKNRPEVYERCARMLFEKWDASRRIHVNLRAGAFIDVAMKHLAYWMLVEGADSDGVEEGSLVKETSSYLGKNFESEADAEKAAKEFVEFCRGRAWVFSDAGSTADGETLYKFTHRTFMEYFAAFHLTRITDTPEELARKLLPHVANEEWDMVGQLAVQIENKHVSDGAERVLTYLLRDKRRRTPRNRDHVLSFIGRCVAFITLPPTLLREVVNSMTESALGRMRSDDIPTPGEHFALATLGGAVDEIRPTIADELSNIVSRLLVAPDDVELDLVGLLIAQTTQLFTLRGQDLGALTPEAQEFWSAWSRSELLKNYDAFVASERCDSAHVFAAWINDVIDTETYLSHPCFSRFDLPLDPMFVEHPNKLLHFTYISATGILLRDVATSGRPGSIDPTGASRRVQSSLRALEHLDHVLGLAGAPPWTALLPDHSYILHYISRSSSDLSDVDPPALWPALVLALCLYEARESRRFRSDASMDGPRTVLDIYHRRSGEVAEDLDLSQAPLDKLDHGQQELVRLWSQREVSFIRLENVADAD